MTFQSTLESQDDSQEKAGSFEVMKHQGEVTAIVHDHVHISAFQKETMPSSLSFTFETKGEFEEFIDTVIEVAEADYIDSISRNFSVFDLEMTESKELILRIDSNMIGFAYTEEFREIKDPRDVKDAVHLPVYETMDSEEGFIQADSKNLESFANFLRTVSETRETGNSEVDEILSQQERDFLDSEIKYGAEITKHLKEGDNCFELGLINPALSSYIHALEWSMISLLEHNEAFDVIEKESNGERFNFAGGSKSIVGKTDEKVGLSQKTRSKLESINKAERRWAAHHKSGHSKKSELESLRERIGDLVAKHKGINFN